MTGSNVPVKLIENGLDHLVHHPEPITYSDFNTLLGSRFNLSSDEAATPSVKSSG